MSSDAVLVKKKTHGKKTDKETQSPVLKLFRDMVQKEKHDPEKTNLLNGKHVEKKRKHFLGYRAKSDQKSLESSSSDIQRPYQPQEHELRSAEYHRSQSHSLPFQASNKSWVFWGEKANAKKTKSNDETCSCVSCALKKLMGGDYTCVFCLAFLFMFTVIIACVLVYRCIPTIATVNPKRDSERLKRKIESIKGWGSFMPRTFGSNKDKWRDSLQDLGLVDADSELSKIIDDSKLNEIQSSVRLRDFYKKLLKADSNIRKLKKKGEYTTFDTNMDFHFDSLPEREKRSINFFKKPIKLFRFKKHKQNRTKTVKTKLKEANFTTIGKSRHKRLGNNSDDTLVFEKEAVLIQYKPRIFPKCSHNIPKDLKPHEHLLKHPFYKNTQRLDELLERFSKNLPELINDQFGLNIDCKHNKVSLPEIKHKIVGHEKYKMTEKPKLKPKEKGSDEYSTDYDMLRKMRNGNPNMDGAKTNGYADFDGDTAKIRDLSTKNYDLRLTISSVMNEKEKRTTPYPDERMPNQRRLLQTDEVDVENINYEDLKEVLTDDNQAHDDSDKRNRKKRLDGYPEINPNIPNPTKYHPPNVNNPNWKGPMPLYPDEINSMIKQGPVVNNPILVNMPSFNQAEEVSDMDYIEDYLDSKYQGLVKLAQAYSDYGVLASKKAEVTAKGANKMTEKRNFATLTDKERFERRKKASEGIRFEIHPTSPARDDNPLPIYNFLQKHIKVTKNMFPRPGYVYSTVTVPRINVRNKKYYHFRNNNLIPPLVKEKRSATTTDGSNLHRIPLECKQNLDMIDLNKDSVEIENKNKEDTLNRINDLTKQVNDLKSLTDTETKLNDRIKIENDNDNSKVIFKKRSLKYFKEANETQQYDDMAIFDTKEHSGNRFTEKINKLESKINNISNVSMKDDFSKENVSFNGTKLGVKEMSDFFSMMSDLFSVMNAEEATTLPAQATTNATTKTTPMLNTTDFIYSMYDSEMFDNIGHRSRLLMSMNNTRKKRAFGVGGKLLTVNITDKILPQNVILLKNRTGKKVKRHVDDNTIFWNDLYDDEYGVKMDVMENIKDKNSATNDFFKRSNEWIQNKVKRISDNFHRTATEDGDDGKRAARSAKNRHKNGNRKYYYGYKNMKLNRKTRKSEENEGRRTDFSALTVHMKDVCRRAANAVKGNGEAIERDERSDDATTGLMQQLVNLMTDLIDYQVQQRTCMKLPPDLYNFLEWLTEATPQENDEKSARMLYSVPIPEEIREVSLPEKPVYRPSDQITTDMPSEREDQDPRSDCLGTLQAIQDLLRNFNEMPADDKSKMTGVKEYLMSQITYLKKRIADEGYNGQLRLPDGTWFRYKRDQSKRRGHHKFLRNYSKKHTRTTAGYYDGVTFSEPYETLTGEKVKDKRNLRDIYYKALAESKKITTVKHNTR